MAVVAGPIEARARVAVDVLCHHAAVRAAYIFGSRVEGRADGDSDIDLAVFAEGTGKWDIENVAGWVARGQEAAGDDIEIHFFPAEALHNASTAGFAGHVIGKGKKVF